MTKEQKNKILTVIAEDRNDYARDCCRRIAKEEGKIIGADYMLQRLLDVLKTEVEPQESEVNNATNGDVIKTIFPNSKYEILYNTVFTDIDNGWFTLDWWNAPYQKGGKE